MFLYVFERGLIFDICWEGGRSQKEDTQEAGKSKVVINSQGAKTIKWLGKE